MTTWVLVLTLNFVTMHSVLGFGSAEECEAAGSQWKKQMQGHKSEFTCMKQTKGR